MSGDLADKGRSPRILWVASKPPLPPFAGGTLKAVCGISALADAGGVDVVTFAEPGRGQDVARRFRERWPDRTVGLRVLDYGPGIGPLRALRRRRFQFGATLETPALRAALEEMDWRRADRLLLFDDICFAPLMPTFGGNAIFSPHDCISEMLRSHFRSALPRPAAAKAWGQHRVARHYEQAFYHQALLVHVVTHRDRLWLQEINPAARYHTLPFVDETVLARGSARPECENDFDVLIWGDLRLAPIARGTASLLRAMAQDASRWQGRRVVLVGRVSPARAAQSLGAGLLRGVTYAPYLEDEAGRIRRAKVVVIPDTGGAGIKSRCLSILYAAGCLACLYSQMEGLEPFCDVGAINAFTMPDLAARVAAALSDGSWARVADRGGALYDLHLGPVRMRQDWGAMVRRAVAVRDRGVS